MFRAHFNITREMTSEIIGMEEERDGEDPRDFIAGGQPLSSAFDQSMPNGQPARMGAGKTQDRFGDEVINDKGGVVGDGLEDRDIEEIIAQRAELKEFGECSDPVV